MKIAHILWSLGTGGTENMVVDIASIQAETEDVAIFVINDHIEQYMLDKLNPKCKVYFVNRKPGSKNPLPLIMLNIALKRFKPDIIHHHANKSVYCIKVCKNVPIIRTSHGIGNPSPEFTRYRKIIAISKAVQNDMKKYGLESTIIYNGIKVNTINHILTKPFQDGKLHFVQVSRLYYPVKGQDLVIKAVKKLVTNGQTNFIMHFIGNGETEEELKDLVRKYHLEDFVLFEGRKDQQEIYQKLCNYDLFIQASRIEGFGLTIAEAMAAKVPTLVSNIPAPMEVIKNGELGQHFISDNAEDLATQIENFIINGRDGHQIDEAYKHVCQYYDVSLTAKKYIEVYNSVL